MKSCAASSEHSRTSMAWPENWMSSCAIPSGSPLGDPQLQFDQIEPGDGLGDGMLDLQPRVHLHEIEFAAAIEQEFQRARALIAKRLDRGRPRSRPSAPAIPADTAGDGASSISFWCRRCTEQSRSPRWIALPWRSPNTWISMWRGSTIARSRITVASPNAALRLGARAAQRIGKRRCVRDQPHAAPAAAGDGLDHHGKADLVRLPPASRHRSGRRPDSRARRARRPPA